VTVDTNRNSRAADGSGRSFRRDAIRFDVVLAALRRRLLVTSWVVVSTQSLVVALGTAQMCADPEHTHAGVAAPDCAMHHQHGPAPVLGDPHHGHTGPSQADTDIRIGCRCSTDMPPTFLGENGMIERPLVTSPSMQVLLLSLPSVEPSPDHVVPPSSPPPRVEP